MADSKGSYQFNDRRGGHFGDRCTDHIRIRYDLFKFAADDNELTNE
jgi:hypothetical protein